jgi:hypothetical protein
VTRFIVGSPNYRDALTIFGAFQGEGGAFVTATGSAAITAYPKFLSGSTLVESTPVS